MRALERELALATRWSTGFFEALEDIKPGDAVAIDEMKKAVLAKRHSKGPPKL